MAATKADITKWVTSWYGNREALDKYSHVIIVCDTYDWEDYPVYVAHDEDVHEVKEKHNGTNMQKVMEVYWLGGDIEAQLNMSRCFTYGPAKSDH